MTWGSPFRWDTCSRPSSDLPWQRRDRRCQWWRLGLLTPISGPQQLLGSSSLLADTLKFFPPPHKGDQEIKASQLTVLTGHVPSSQKQQGGPPKKAEASQAKRKALHPAVPRILPAALKEGNLPEIHSSRYTCHQSCPCRDDHWTG